MTTRKPTPFLLLFLLLQVATSLHPQLTIDRRQALASVLPLHHAAFAAAPAAAAEGQREQTLLLAGIDEASEIIKAAVDSRFMSEIKEAGGKFIYRGLPPGTPSNRPSLFLFPSSDLLDKETYGSASAAAFFAALDREMAALRPTGVRPSNGHLATPSATAAGQWGQAASIWPLGESHYAFCGGSSSSSSSGGGGSSSSGSSSSGGGSRSVSQSILYSKYKQ